LRDAATSGGSVKARGWAVSLVVVALLAAACSRSGGTAKNVSSSTSVKSVVSGDFGTLKAVCGPGTGKGATDVGVTDTSITVGTMADPGSSVQPGLDQELFDSADAFVGWCNAAGGILGRRLTVHKWDAKLFEVAPRMIDACQGDFTLVGNGEALDASGADQRVKCHLPEIPTYDVSKQASTAPLSVEPLPNPDYTSGLYGPYRNLKQIDPEASRHYAMLSLQFQSVKDQGLKDRAAAEAAGYTTVYYDELPVVVDNWRPYAQNLQNKGVQVFTMESSSQMIAALFKAMDGIGYHPKYAIFNPNVYDPTFLANAGGALQGTVYAVTSFVPFELAATHPATKQYIDDLAKYAGGAKPKALGAQAWSAWLLFAESAKACGSHLTRGCLLDQARAVKSWTGGGLHAPSHPGDASAQTGECFTMIQASPTGFSVDRRVTTPNSDVFNCSPANVVRLPGFPQ
jgi:ABC-type branched-subunit amino acid transport system substrate-binding protein